MFSNTEAFLKYTDENNLYVLYESKRGKSITNFDENGELGLYPNYLYTRIDLSDLVEEGVDKLSSTKKKAKANLYLPNIENKSSSVVFYEQTKVNETELYKTMKSDKSFKNALIESKAMISTGNFAFSNIENLDSIEEFYNNKLEAEMEQDLVHKESGGITSGSNNSIVRNAEGNRVTTKPDGTQIVVVTNPDGTQEEITVVGPTEPIDGDNPGSDDDPIVIGIGGGL